MRRFSLLKRLLIANRGEIALRIMRTAKELGMTTVAVYSEVDRGAAHVAYADQAYLLGPAAPSQSYLNIERIVTIARQAEADAIHPGYGFLAENANFAHAVLNAGMTWVGPHPTAIEIMGDKIRARRAMVSAGIPVVPGGTKPITTLSELERAAHEHGFPLAIKASAGGGGKGLKVAHSPEELASAFSTAQREAEAYFKNPTVYVERYLENPKHIELQILADKHGNIVHVGERDCSLQRRHQKLFEEGPANISVEMRENLRAAGIRAARAIEYDSVGTIETLVSGNQFFFLEMNTRIQVEHTVSEMLSGLDLIREQLRVAAGEPLGYDQHAINLRGHAIEVRANAEDPTSDFRPAPGMLTDYREPAGFGVRVDSAVKPGDEIVADYDSLIGKLVVWAPTRPQALARLRRAIDDYTIGGIPTTLRFLRALSQDETVVNAGYGTASLEAFARTYTEPLQPEPSASPAVTPQALSDVVRVEVNNRLFLVRILDQLFPTASLRESSARRPPTSLPRPKVHTDNADSNEIRSPMHGVIVDLPVVEGMNVTQGQVVAVIEAMKMMNEIRAHRAGEVVQLSVKIGATVEARTPILILR
ncbi:MAG TPA: biotin carboxylase N-terminal domain-containing protein [Candidatus Baltobacteraceae bacterium]|jgi:acetyl-CoA/propionyl-CoA carboxylase biotin carboxyl carrier protein|nr:biotin carboxylase N-terminal domain-containing protein [Candidatus Baltobacteraceae bacterium]